MAEAHINNRTYYDQMIIMIKQTFTWNLESYYYLNMVLNSKILDKLIPQKDSNNYS